MNWYEYSWPSFLVLGYKFLDLKSRMKCPQAVPLPRSFLDLQARAISTRYLNRFNRSPSIYRFRQRCTTNSKFILFATSVSDRLFKNIPRGKNCIILYKRKPYVKEIKGVLKYHGTVDISINGTCGFGGSLAKARGLTSFRGSWIWKRGSMYLHRRIS